MKDNKIWFQEACLLNKLLYKPDDVDTFSTMVEEAFQNGTDILEARITSFLGITMNIDTLLKKYPGLQRQHISPVFPEKSCILCDKEECKEVVRKATKGEFREYCRGDFKPMSTEDWKIFVQTL